jgi:5'-deoxynucleotidase
MNSNFLALWFRAKNIKRWPLQTNLTHNDDATHSFECAIVAHLIGTIDRDVFGNNTNPEELAMLAIFHESGEVAGLGDVNFNAKNISPEVNKAFKDIELMFEQSMLKGLPTELLSSYEKLIIQDKSTRLSRLNKASDDICAYLEAEKEFNLGNFEYKDAYKQCRKNVDKWAVEFKCVSWFCEKFIDSVNQTIDSQLNKKNPKE